VSLLLVEQPLHSPSKLVEIAALELMDLSGLSLWVCRSEGSWYLCVMAKVAIHNLCISW
jgi:hypothetical protein